MVRFICFVALTLLLALIVRDSYFHFDDDRAQQKIKVFSGQRHWSSFYDQSQVYKNASFRYLNDFASIQPLLTPQSLVLSDKATSYYVAASLPVFVLNIQRHHGRHQQHRAITPWVRFIDGRKVCYLEFEEHRIAFSEFLKSVKPRTDDKLFVKYLIVNRDGETIHRKSDCLAFRSHTLTEYLPQFSTLLYEGEYLDLYELRY